MSAYQVFVNDVEMPVAPAEIDTVINGQNETVQLLSGHEFNQINHPGLTELSMKLRLPHHDVHYASNWQPQQTFLDLFERLKTDEKSRVFSVMILRSGAATELSDGYFEYMTLEEYRIQESTDEGLDLLVECTFKQFRPLRTKTLQVKENAAGGFTATAVPVTSHPASRPESVEAVAGDSLWLIAQKYLGDGERYGEVAKLNGISNPNRLAVGQKVRLP